LPALEQVAIPERQVMLWTRPLRPALFEPDRFPVFNMEAPEGRFYGFPAHGTPTFKIGKYNHRRERVEDPDTMDRTCHSEDEAVLREGISRYFPDANGATVEMKTCLFTNSPDEHFIIDRLPDAPQVAIAAGCSGHAFKFCSVVGEILADLALDGGTNLNIELFRFDRPALERAVEGAHSR
jgi:sarcosine oxidase